MFAAINVLFCLLIPAMFALLATVIALTAVRRHITLRQLVFATFVLVANLSSVCVLFQAIFTGQSISVLPLLLIGFTMLLAIGQLVIATVLGAVGRLRRQLA